MWSKIHIFLGSFVEIDYVERVCWFYCSLCVAFPAKLKGEFAENCYYESSFLYAFMKDFDELIPSIQTLCFVSHELELPYDEQKVLNVDEFLKALLFENIHGFQFYYFHLKELKWLLICGKENNGRVLKAHLYNIVKTTFENSVFELTWKILVEKHLIYSIPFIDFLFKDDIFNDLLVQNTSSCVKLLNHSFDGTLLII
ncbi:hypothetical protein M9H77_02799 [Catharanthus roseus]|uniref:Uncharacterized protein n=1 Tax=Catharanthus roseus TaxID=4058 RepID=A0ACC0C9H4_CATRO|nr:hypothetical protein M9H77_02799 [Catharanthus roseus]